ncbi:MAG: hypothetical protein ABIF92_02165, partial [archaeon]
LTPANKEYATRLSRLGTQVDKLSAFQKTVLGKANGKVTYVFKGYVDPGIIKVLEKSNRVSNGIRWVVMQ